MLKRTSHLPVIEIHILEHIAARNLYLNHSAQRYRHTPSHILQLCVRERFPFNFQWNKVDSGGHTFQKYLNKTVPVLRSIYKSLMAYPVLKGKALQILLSYKWSTVSTLHPKNRETSRDTYRVTDTTGENGTDSWMCPEVRRWLPRKLKIQAYLLTPLKHY